VVRDALRAGGSTAPSGPRMSPITVAADSPLDDRCDHHGGLRKFAAYLRLLGDCSLHPESKAWETLKTSEHRARSGGAGFPVGEGAALQTLASG